MTYEVTHCEGADIFYAGKEKTVSGTFDVYWCPCGTLMHVRLTTITTFNQPKPEWKPHILNSEARHANTS